MNYRELDIAFKKIISWYKKKTKVININTRPYNSAFVFYDLTSRIISDNGKVLYVVCTTKSDIGIRSQEDFYKMTIGSKMVGNVHDGIKYITIDELGCEVGNYDLIIFDDITFFSKITTEKLREVVEKLYWKSNKIIIYSCEKVFPVGEKFDLVYLLEALPMIEPRVINTRLRLEEDIPLTLYEYIKWFKENRKRVLIVVPTEDRLNKVYSSYRNALKRNNIRVVKYLKNDNFKIVKQIILEDSDCVFIVTNALGSFINEIEDLNVIVLFADNINYQYKKIVYLCGAIKIKADILPEVLLVSKDISMDMDKSKEIIRSFNKSLWEKRVLK